MTSIAIQFFNPTIVKKIKDNKLFKTLNSCLNSIFKTFKKIFKKPLQNNNKLKTLKSTKQNFAEIFNSIRLAIMGQNVNLRMEFMNWIKNRILICIIRQGSVCFFMSRDGVIMGLDVIFYMDRVFIRGRMWDGEKYWIKD